VLYVACNAVGFIDFSTIVALHSLLSVVLRTFFQAAPTLLPYRRARCLTMRRDGYIQSGLNGGPLHGVGWYGAF